MPPADDELFEFDHAPHVSRETSQADTERRNRVYYHRRGRRARTESCQDCIAVKLHDPKAALRPAVYIRTHGAEEVLLCFEHKQDRLDREQLNGTKS